MPKVKHVLKVREREAPPQATRRFEFTNKREAERVGRKALAVVGSDGANVFDVELVQVLDAERLR